MVSFVRRLTPFVPFVWLALYACSEATDGITPEAGASGPDAGLSSPSVDSSFHEEGGSSGTVFDAGNLNGHVVLINEISAREDWVELVNSGNAAADITGFMVADRNKDDGTPKVADAVLLPPGTILSPKSYVIVQAGGLDGGGKQCPDGGQSWCFHAEFGVSNKDGETIFLLAPDGGIVGSAVYPPKAAADDETWGRVPSADPDGGFETTVPTPGAVNQKKK